MKWWMCGWARGRGGFDGICLWDGEVAVEGRGGAVAVLAPLWGEDGGTIFAISLTCIRMLLWELTMLPGDS